MLRVVKGEKPDEEIKSQAIERISSLDNETKARVHLISQAYIGFCESCMISLSRFEKINWKCDNERLYDLFFNYCIDIPDYKKIFMSSGDSRFSFQSIYFEYFNHTYEFFIFLESVINRSYKDKYKVIPLDFSNGNLNFKQRLDYFDHTFVDINSKRDFLKLTCFAVEIIEL